VLGSDEEFAGEGSVGGPASQGLLRGEMGKVGIVVLLRDVGEDEITGAGIEAVRIGEEFADSMVGKMAGAGEHALLDDPGIRADLEHVEVVIGFEDQAIGLTKVDLDHFRKVTEVGADGDLCAVAAESEPDGIGGVVRNGEGVNVDIADGKMLASLDGLDTLEALPESVREDALQGVHGGLGDEQRRRFPKAESLRKAIAMVAVLVSNEDGVEPVNIAANGGKAGEGFALAKTSVDEDASAFCLQESDVARATGRQNGNAQGDGNPPEKPLSGKLLK